MINDRSETIVLMNNDCVIIGTAESEELAEEMISQGLIKNWFKVKHYKTRDIAKGEPKLRRELKVGRMPTLSGYKVGQRIAFENFRDVKPGENLIIVLPKENLRVSISFVKGLLENIRTDKIEFEGNEDLVNTFIRYSKY